MKRSARRVVVIGAGPAGIIAAFELSKSFDTILVVRSSSAECGCFRVDSVPASLLALLVDLGIHPGEIGVDALHTSQLRAWESDAVQENSIPASAHVERPLLETVLLRHLTASTKVKTLSFDLNLFEHFRSEERNQKIYLLDATGRRSISSSEIARPPRPWVARSYVASSRAHSADHSMRIASLPHGYVYRMGSSKHLVLAVVGRGPLVGGSPQRIEQYIVENGAGWILQGLPPLSELKCGKASTASVQWSSSGTGCRIGDAALARDSISGQGIALGITDAMCAASALREQGNFDLLLQRQSEQRCSHMRSLVNAIQSSRFAPQSTWRDYSRFLELNTQPAETAIKVALRDGRLHRREPALSS